jgi:hypothetical protein
MDKPYKPLAKPLRNCAVADRGQEPKDAKTLSVLDELLSFSISKCKVFLERLTIDPWLLALYFSLCSLVMSSALQYTRVDFQLR